MELHRLLNDMLDVFDVNLFCCRSTMHILLNFSRHFMAADHPHRICLIAEPLAIEDSNNCHKIDSTLKQRVCEHHPGITPFHILFELKGEN